MSMKQIVKVKSGAGDAMVMGVIAITIVALAALAAIVAVAAIALVVVAVVACMALSAAGGMKYARYHTESRAALKLWRNELVTRINTEQNVSCVRADVMQLLNPPKPRVALAMRKLQEPDKYMTGRHAAQTPVQPDAIWRRGI